MGKRKHISEQEFDKIKQLLELGLKPSMISKAMDRSPSAISTVVHATSYKEMRKPKQPKAQTLSTVTANDLDMINALQNINATLVNMGKSIKFIEENVEVNKRRIFR